MSDEGVSESRFYMWRAIFALAHADGKVNKAEEDFMDSHLRTVPFSLRQKAILEDDIIHAKDPGEMLAMVTSHEDQGMFFEFARMMCWSDGNYDVQEKEIMERLLGVHMEKLDVEGLTSALHESREKAEQIHKLQDEYEDDQAQRKVGLGVLIGRLFASERDKRLPQHGLNDSEFNMWRTIFAMAHADNEVTKDELAFMYDALEKEDFSREQRAILEKDIEVAQDPAELFMKIGKQEDRSRFFYYARMMCWSDGNFDEQEQEIILRLKSLHVRNVDFEKMLQDVSMEIDESDKEQMAADMSAGKHPIKNFLKRFRSR